MTDRAAQMSPRCFSSAHVHVKWDSSGRCRPLVHHYGRQMRSKYDRSAIARRSWSSMSRSRLATQVSAIDRRSCDDREICGRSRSRMMLELMRERAATARPMRIAPDREARQRSCAEQHGWTAPSSAPSIQAASPRSTVGGPLLGDLTNKGETVLNGRPFLCRSPKTVLTKNLFLGRPRWPSRSGARTALWGRWSDSWVTVTRGDHSPHIPPHL